MKKIKVSFLLCLFFYIPFSLANFDALIDTIKKRDLPGAKALIEEGLIDINSKDSNGKTVLHLVSSFFIDGVSFARYFVKEHGIDIDSKDSEGKTALHWATYMGNKNLAKYLVGLGADIHLKDSKGRTVLHFAVFSGEIDLVKYFVKLGADVKARTKNGNTVLHWAAASRFSLWKQDILRYLVINGAKQEINLQNNYGITVLHMLASNPRDFRSLSYLVEAQGANIHLKDVDGNTILHEASSSNWNLPTIKVLVRANIDINAKNKYGATALHFASQYAHLGTVAYLADNGGNIHAKTADGATALHFASELSGLDKPFHHLSWSKRTFLTKSYNYIDYRLDVIKYLIREGIDIQAKDKNGKTALDLVSTKGDLDSSIFSFLQDVYRKQAEMEKKEGNLVSRFRKVCHKIFSQK